MVGDAIKSEVRVLRPSLWLMPAATALLAAIIFIADLSAPLNLAFCTLYVAVVLMASAFCSARVIVMVGAGCIVLSVAIALHLGGSVTNLSGMSNIVIAVAAIAITTFLVVRGKNAETVLRERANLLDLAQDTVFSRDMDNVITYWNRGAEEVYGWKRCEAVGRVCHDLLATSFPVPLAEISETLLRTDRWEGELTHRRRDGTKLAVSSRWSLLRDGQGKPVAILESNTDITERKRAEEALRASEAHYRTFVDHATDAFFVYDEDLKVVDVNQHACESLGYCREELIGMHLYDLHAEQEGTSVENVAAQFSSSGTVTVQCFHRRKDGTVFPAETRSRPFQRGGQRLRLALSRDISERRRAEQRLNAQYSVNQILAQVATVEEAAPKVLEAVCRSLGWNLGSMWRVDAQAGALRCIEIWCDRSLQDSNITEAARADTYKPGVGGLGQVWASGAPALFPNIADLPDDQKALIPVDVLRAGLHSAVGVPIFEAGVVVGVISFASFEIRQPEPELLNTMTTVGNLLGQFIERKRAEAAVRERDARFRVFFDSNIFGVFTWRTVGQTAEDGDVAFVDVNDAFLRMTGCNRDEVLAGPVSQMRLTPPQ